MKSILILPDLQVPYHDTHFVKLMRDFIEDFQPDDIGQIGDLMDQPQPSRWNKGLAGEYEDTLQEQLDTTKKIIDDLHIQWVKMGNHDERIEAYVERYAPALRSLHALRIENLLELEDRGVRVYREPFEVAPGWIAAHGHETRSLSAVSGRTAYGLARRFDSSVVCGHTHRAGIVAETVGLNEHRTFTGMEVGHGMDLKYATYVQSPNWQQAFGILHVDEGQTQPELIPVHNGRFVYQGKVYK